MAPDPDALSIAQAVYADALERNGFSRKAERVRAMSDHTTTPSHQLLPSDSAVDVVTTAGPSALSDGTASLNGSDCSDEAFFCNYSDTWLKIKGDYYYWANVDCWEHSVGWVAPDQCVGYGWGDWFDVDNMWNCYGDLRVGSKTVGPGSDS